MAVSLCKDSTEKDLLQDVTFRSFSGQEIAGNKNPGVPGSCIISTARFFGEVPLSLLVITVERGGGRIEWYPETISYDREDPFVLR